MADLGCILLLQGASQTEAACKSESKPPFASEVLCAAGGLLCMLIFEVVILATEEVATVKQFVVRTNQVFFGHLPR